MAVYGHPPPMKTALPRKLASTTPAAGTSKNTQTTTQTQTQTTSGTTADPALIRQNKEMYALLQRYLKQYAAQGQALRAPSVAAQMKSIGGFYKDYSGNVLTDIQLRNAANRDVSGIIGPQLKAVADLYQRRGVQGEHAINDLTGDYIGRLRAQATQTQEANQANLAQMSGLDAGLANFARDRNAQMPELTAALQGMNASPELTAETAGRTAALGDQGAIDVAALGASTLQRMGSETTAANTFAGAQPGFALQEGQQQMGMFQSGLRESMQTDIGNIEAKMPELVNQVYSTLLDNNNAQRSLKAQRGQTLAGAYGDAQTNALNSRIAQAAVMQNLASITGGSLSDFLSAVGAGTKAGGTTTTNTTTTEPIAPGTAADPFKIVGDAASAIQAKLYLDPDFSVKAYNNNPNLVGDPIKRSWAWWHPAQALRQIENQIRTETRGQVIPDKLIRQKAIETLKGLGLRTPAQAKAAQSGFQQPVGGLPSTPGPPGGSGGFGGIWDWVQRNPLLAGGVAEAPVLPAAGIAAGAKSAYDWLFR